MDQMLCYPHNCCWSVYMSYKNYIQDSKEIFEDLIDFANKQNVDGLLNDHIKRLNDSKQAVEQNATFINKTIELYEEKFENKIEVKKSLETCCCERPNPHQNDMIQNILQQTIREWSIQAKQIRELTFGPLCSLVGSGKKVFIPGCGMARLPFELQLRGNSCYVCECNHFILLALNTITASNPNQYTILPYINTTSDLIDSSQLLIPYSVPDVEPSILKDVQFSDKDFVSYCESTKETFDVVCTCYFIDTALNVVDYIKGIEKVLKPKGLWINLGPVHWVNDCYSSLHLSLNEIIDVALKLNFSLVKKEMIEVVNYIPQLNSTTPTTYIPCLFVMAKN